MFKFIMDTLLSNILLCLLMFAHLAASDTAPGYKLICYYGTWATYRTGYGQFNVEDVDVDLCTHVVYTFMGLREYDGSVTSLDPWLDLNAADGGGRDNLRKFTALKKKNPNLKTILAIGGWNEGSRKYSIMAANPSLRKTFVASSLEFLLKYKFDGLDFDWEYPNQRDSVYGLADVDNFTELLKELKAAYEALGLSLSIAAAASADSADLSYDIPEISKHVDFISVMAYDFYGAWDDVTGHNAPLFPGEGDDEKPRDSLYTVNAALEYWLQAGIPPEKLILGMPLYGRSFILADAGNSQVKAPVTGPGIAGPYTNTPGLIGYNEFCNLTASINQWDIRYDDLAKVPYAVRGRDWVSFDDSQSLVAKVEYGQNLGIGGVMLWGIETDDFHGGCQGIKNPLAKAVKTVLEKRPYGIPCDVCGEEKGLAANPEDSNTFYNCVENAEGNIHPVLMRCPPQLHWDSKTQACYWPLDAFQSGVIEGISRSLDELKQSLCDIEESLIPNPEDCGSFYYCAKDGDGGTAAVLMKCPTNLFWNQDAQACDWPQNVNCPN